VKIIPAFLRRILLKKAAVAVVAYVLKEDGTIERHHDGDEGAIAIILEGIKAFIAPAQPQTEEGANNG